MPIPNDYRQIVNLLYQKTEEGVLQWFETSSTVVVNIDEVLLSIWTGVDEETDEPFMAFAMNNKGEHKPIDSWYLDQSDDDFDLSANLYRSAKRNAKGVPTLLKKLAERISAM